MTGSCSHAGTADAAVLGSAREEFQSSGQIRAFLRSQGLSLVLGASDSELSQPSLTSCFFLQVYVCGCFQRSVCGRGLQCSTLQAYGDKHCLFFFFFLQLGHLSGSEPGAVTLAAEKPDLRGMRCIFPFSKQSSFPSPPQVLSFVSFVCFAASTAAAFVTVPLLEFLAALFLLFAYSTKFNERFKSFRWPLMVRVETCPSWMNAHLNVVSVHFQDFMRCVTASIIYFIVSIMAVSRYYDSSSKAAGVNPSSPLCVSTGTFLSAVPTPIIRLFADIWFHRHHRVCFRFLSHF